MSAPRFLLSLAASLSLSTIVAAYDDPTLERRLEDLAERLEAAREDAHVPGMSIAIVKDDAVVWARGFGLADVAAGRAADAETIYAVGSTTKAFTATLVGMLVDEGRLDWDDPVTKYLPYFDLQVKSDDEGAACTLRDLLSHRHGFARMGILWIGGNVPREEILRTAAGAEPLDDFRANFHYCNVTYLAAGEAAGVAGGSTWNALMEERLLGPLGMRSSTLSTRAARQDPRLALGYTWHEAEEELEQVPMLELDCVGPAGSLNSNVVDMAQWVRLQLGRGAVDGERRISERQLAETWSPQVAIDGGVSYGLGWMLRERDGRRIVEHGGNIDGFSAEVALLPDEGLGYVLLLNQSASPLREASLDIVIDALLGERPTDPAADDAATGAVAVAPDGADLEALAGTYVANFATFRDEEFEVRLADGGLALFIPSQQEFALEPPDADGRWVFALTDRIAVTFQRDPQGAVVGLTVHQGGFSFEVPREDVAPRPEVAPEVLEPYTGTFVRERGGKRVEIFVLNGRLAIEDQGKWLDFTTPDERGHAALRARPEQGATFTLDAEGKAESFVFHGDAGDRLFTRLRVPGGEDLPSLEEVLTLRGTAARRAALARTGGSRLTGAVWIAQAGVRGTITLYTRGSDRYANHIDLGPFGRIDVVARGRAAWRRDPHRGLRALRGAELAQALLEHPGAVTGDWSEYFDEVAVVRNDVVDDRPVHVVRLKQGDLPSRTYWVDAERGDVLRVKQVALEGAVRLPVTVDYSEFALVDGVRTPLRIVMENPESGRTIVTFARVESGLELGDEVFTLEDPGAPADGAGD